MYNQEIWTFPGSREIEYKYAGNYGAKGEKRAPRKKATPEQIKKQNQWIRVTKIRRLMKANFRSGDWWLTVKYPKGVRKSVEDVKKDFKRFRETLRKWYRERGEPLKYIFRMEIGRRGGIHIHMVVNRIRDGDLLIQQAWQHGRVNFQGLYDAGGFQDLAEYIVKLPDRETEKQLSLFGEPERKELISYSCSRNLIRSVPERKQYSHWTMRRILRDGPTPAPGYYIDMDSIVSGVNPFTGLSYFKYTEVCLDERAADDG